MSNPTAPDQTPSQQQSLTPTSPSTRTLSPLEVPELLEHIFSYVNQHTLRTAVLVCRSWYLLNQDNLFREVTWDTNWRPFAPKHALKQLPGAGRLVLSCSQDNPEWRGPDLHNALLALHTPTRQWTTLSPLAWYRHKTSSAAASSAAGFSGHSLLREMVLITGLNFKDTSMDLLPLPPSLTSLTIHQDSRVSLDIGRILAICPLLRTLHLSSKYVMVFRGPYTSQGKSALQDALPLQSLVLKHPAVRQPWIENLLMITPRLRELQLINIKGYNGAPWHGPRFREYLQELSLPHLSVFHFSQHWSSIYEPEQAEMAFAICPLAKERPFLCYDFSQDLVSSLTAQPIMLTTLEVLLPYDVCCYRDGWQRDFSDNGSTHTARHLHQLLCECLNLRHLKTLKIPYMNHWMDIYRRLGYFSIIEGYGVSARQVKTEPGIWICRGLETLEVDLHIHEHAQVRGDMHMRIVYGYVARVCPRLRDVRISFPTFCQLPLGHEDWDYKPFALGGGLCLLSRLTRLERLRVEYRPRTVECKIEELNWLCRSGRMEKHREKRKAIVDAWKGRCQWEDGLEDARERNTTGFPITLLGSGGDDVDLMDSMKSLGLLRDVVDMVAEMDTEEFVCLPELRQLACGRHLEQTPEKEMRSVFYTESSGI